MGVGLVEIERSASRVAGPRETVFSWNDGSQNP
jgi:hypothetical protein